jgi:sec-independent protein translocase protein TatB
VEFLGVGWQEVLLILVLLLVVVGPERLPTVAYQLGRAVRTLQGYARAVRSEFSEELSYIEEQYKTVKGEIDTTRQSFREQQAQFEAEMRETTRPLQEAVAELQAPPSNVVSLPARAGSTAYGETVPPAGAPAEPGTEEAGPPPAAGPPLVF